MIIQISNFKKRKTKLLDRIEKLKQLSYQKQSNSISDQNKWTHIGIIKIVLQNSIIYHVFMMNNVKMSLSFMNFNISRFSLVSKNKIFDKS